jgi:hypothetical protein
MPFDVRLRCDQPAAIPDRRSALGMTEAEVLYLTLAVDVCFVVGVVAFPFVIFGVLRAVLGAPVHATLATRWEYIPAKSAIVFVASIAIGMFLTQVVGSHARSKALTFLQSLPSPHTVLANGLPVKDDTKLLAALKRTHFVIGHHSHPEKMIRLKIEAAGSVMNLTLGRDSQDPNQYWVFFPDYRTSLMNEIGRIDTAALDSY